jgi:hypothetical protein
MPRRVDVPRLQGQVITQDVNNAADNCSALTKYQPFEVIDPKDKDTAIYRNVSNLFTSRHGALSQKISIFNNFLLRIISC